MDATNRGKVGQEVGGEVPVIRAERERVFDSQIAFGCAGPAARWIPAPRLVPAIDLAEIGGGRGIECVEHKVRINQAHQVTERVMDQGIIGLPGGDQVNVPEGLVGGIERVG